MTARYSSHCLQPLVLIIFSSGKITGGSLLPNFVLFLWHNHAVVLCSTEDNTRLDLGSDQSGCFCLNIVCRLPVSVNAGCTKENRRIFVQSYERVLVMCLDPQIVVGKSRVNRNERFWFTPHIYSQRHKECLLTCRVPGPRTLLTKLCDRKCISAKIKPLNKYVYNLIRRSCRELSQYRSKLQR